MVSCTNRIRRWKSIEDKVEETGILVKEDVKSKKTPGTKHLRNLQPCEKTKI